MIDNKNPSFTNNNLRDFLEIIKNDSRIRISNCQFEKNLSDISLSTKLRGAKEDAFYVDKDYYRINIRRGSSFFYINNHPIIARKGLQKFFYLKLTHLVEITPNIIHGETKKKNDKSKIRTIIMKPLIEAFNSKFEVQLYELNKANGENCQISFLPQLDRWVIASKNVSLLAKEEKDLKIYEGTQRFHFATLIAHSWFEILNSHKIDIEILKKNLQNKTLIGEYCGNPNHQHLVNYEKTDLLFFAIVDHDSNDSCLPPHQAFNFFKIHNLSHVSMKDWGIFSNMESLKSKLIQIFKSISKGLLKEDGEGSVVYFAKVDEKKVPIQVLSLCKIKTLEYSILRKLREKLKTLVNLNFKKSKENPKAFISQLFKKETENLCKNVCPLIDIEINKYSIIAEKCFNYIMDNKIERKSIQDNYLKILTKVKESLESKINKKSEEYMNSEEITKSEEEKKSEEKKYYDPDLNFEILFHQEN